MGAMGLLGLGDNDMDPVVKSKIAFYTNGIVLGTLFINGTTVCRLYKWLQIESPSRKQHHLALQRVLFQRADDQTQQKIDALSKHWFFHNTDVNIVKKLVPNLVESITHAEKDFYGRRKHTLLTLKHVEHVMDELLQKIGFDRATHETHFQ